MKLLSGPLYKYEHITFPKRGEEEDGNEGVHPLLVIAMAALDLGWQLAIENGEGDEQVRGLAVGTQEYMDKLFPNEPPSETVSESA